MKKLTAIRAAFFALLAIGIHSCSKNNSPGPTNHNYHYYLSNTASPDSAQYTTQYYYNANNQLLGLRTDSLDDTLIYNGAGQIGTRYITHLKAAPFYKIAAGQIDTTNFVYDSQGRIAQYTGPNRVTGVVYEKRVFVYDANNNIVSDSAYGQTNKDDTSGVLTSYENRSFSGGNVTQTVLTYTAKHYRPYPGSLDSITQVTTNYTLDNHPNTQTSWDNNTRIAIGNFNKNTNTVVARSATGTGKTGNVLYTYTYSTVLTYDPITGYPVSAYITSSGGAGGAGIGPYHLNYTYNSVTY